MLTAELARKVFAYDTATGELRWLVSPARNVKAGSVAGVFHARDGYRYITYCKKSYLAHRIVWLMHTGSWPSKFIDHVDGDRKNNLFTNLRQADHTINAQNIKTTGARNTSGVLGVRFRKGKFEAAISCKASGKRSIYLGRFTTADAAHHAYLAAKRRMHPGCTI